RFLETGELQKVGSDRAQRTSDVRIIAATNRDLVALMAQGLFREDLFYRLNVIHIVVPPLRERREDVPALVEHFLARLLTKHARPNMTISEEAMRALVAHAWPGNVRELQNVIERLAVTARHETIGVDDLPVE